MKNILYAKTITEMETHYQELKISTINNIHYLEGIMNYFGIVGKIGHILFGLTYYCVKIIQTITLSEVLACLKTLSLQGLKHSIQFKFSVLLQKTWKDFINVVYTNLHISIPVIWKLQEDFCVQVG